MNEYLEATQLLDFDHSEIKKLVAANGWSELPEYERIGNKDFRVLRES